MAERILFNRDKDAQNRVNEAIATFRKTYYETSEISKIVNTKDASNIEEEGFLQLGAKFYIPKEWFTSDNVAFDIAIEQFATSLVIAETKYLLTSIFGTKDIQKVTITKDVLSDFMAQFKRFSEAYRVQAMFFPVDLYSQIHIEWPKNNPDIQLNFTSGEIAICETRPRIFWSNKYTPVDDFILINKGFAEWTSKPTFKDRLEVSISQSDKEDQLDLLYLTKLKLEIVDPKKILVLTRPAREK
jgi:hypothetical protein